MDEEVGVCAGELSSTISVVLGKAASMAGKFWDLFQFGRLYREAETLLRSSCTKFSHVTVITFRVNNSRSW